MIFKFVFGLLPAHLYSRFQYQIFSIDITSLNFRWNMQSVTICSLIYSTIQLRFRRSVSHSNFYNTSAHVQYHPPPLTRNIAGIRQFSPSPHHSVLICVKYRSKFMACSVSFLLWEMNNDWTIGGKQASHLPFRNKEQYSINYPVFLDFPQRCILAPYSNFRFEMVWMN